MTPRRFDYMEKKVMAELKDKLTYEETYLVVLYEPSTNYVRPELWTGDLGEAKKKAGRLVDDACKTSGWVFMPVYNAEDGSALSEPELNCLGYAYFGGDGDTYFHWQDDASGDQDIESYPSEDKL